MLKSDKDSKEQIKRNKISKEDINTLSTSDLTDLI